MFYEEVAILKCTHKKGFHEEQTAMDLYISVCMEKEKVRPSSQGTGVVGIGRRLVEPRFQQKKICLLLIWIVGREACF